MSNKSSLAPIVVSVYNRFGHFKRCIESLQKNTLSKDSDLIILSDASSVDAHKEIINQIRLFVKTIVGFNSVISIFRDENIGAHRSITEGLLEVLIDYDSFIFLEDDIIVASDFLQYMNGGLSFYKEDSRIFSICGFKTPFDLPETYSKDIYFYISNSPWGFATWKDRWLKVNTGYFDRYEELRKCNKKYKSFLSIGFYIKGILIADSKKQIEACDLRVYYHQSENALYSVYPTQSKTQNWGLDGSGLHCGNQKNGSNGTNLPNINTNDVPVVFERFIALDQDVLDRHKKFVDKISGGFIYKLFKYTWVHRFYLRLKQIILN